ncbi:MAG: efflux RND transporter permease subunit [Planctomycetota bacterium]
MHPIVWFIENPVKVCCGVILLVLFGLLAIFQMPIQLSPDVERPQVTIETVWPGASPQEIEKEIVKEQEDRLRSVEGVVKMSSQSLDSVGSITLEFRVGTNMNQALVKVNSQLEQVREYPQDADKPVIRTSNQFDRSVATLILGPIPPSRERIEKFAAAHPEMQTDLQRVLRATTPALLVYRLKELATKYPVAGELVPPDIDVGAYGKFAEDVVEAQLERVPGVADVFIRGGRRQQLQVIVDPAKLASRGLTIDNLRRALTQSNQDLSAGDFWEGKRRYVVRTIGQFRSPEQVADQIIATNRDQAVRIRDVAEVRLDYEKQTGFVRRFGVQNLSVNVNRDQGANVVEIMRLLRPEVQRLNEGILKQNGLVLTQIYDETTYITAAVNLVQSNIILGSALTVVVLILFLHLGARALVFAPLILATAIAALFSTTWFFVLTMALIVAAGFWFARGTLVIAIAIPISIIGTFLIMEALGRNLNVISLGGLSFAVGMLVDNAIVVLENIFRYSQMGYSPLEASRRAVTEVWGAVLASTLTTLAVFIPVIFLPGEVGQLFGDIALSISAAVGLSLVVSVLVIPMASARLLRQGGGSHAVGSFDGQTTSHLARAIQDIGQWTLDTIVRLNAWLQANWIRQWGLVLGTLLVCGAVSWWLMPKLEYLPTGNRNLIISNVITPPGYNAQQLAEIGTEVEEILKPYWDIDPKTEDTSHLEYPTIADLFYVARDRSVFLGLRAHDDFNARKLVNLVQDKIRNRFPGTIVTASQTSIFGRGSSAGRTVDIEITGPELEQLVAIGGRVMRSVQQAIPDAQARPIPSLDLSSPELHVRLKPDQAFAAGISNNELGYAVNALVDGAYATDYFEGGEKIDLVIMGDPLSTSQTQDLTGQYLATANIPEPVRLDAIASVELSSGPEQVNHRERQRAISIEVNPPARMSLEEAIAAIRQQVLKPLEEDGITGGIYQVNLSGTADKLKLAWDALKWNFLLAILITYLLMAGLFESWTYPLVIILSVPLGLVGGIVGLQLLSRYLVALGEPPQTLDVITMLGFVILVGTVVNNPILLVHQTLVLMREGLGRREAIEQSLSSRIRPILMTTMTTIFGLAPLVFFPGAGSELYRGLGAVVFGGLLLSTVLTLVFIPVLLNLSLVISEWFTGRAVSGSFSSEEKAGAAPVAASVGTAAPAPVYEPPRTVATTGGEAAG